MGTSLVIGSTFPSNSASISQNMEFWTIRSSELVSIRPGSNGQKFYRLDIGGRQNYIVQIASSSTSVNSTEIMASHIVHLDGTEEYNRIYRNGIITSGVAEEGGTNVWIDSSTKLLNIRVSEAGNDGYHQSFDLRVTAW